jgi:hypothetical protein
MFEGFSLAEFLERCGFLITGFIIFLLLYIFYPEKVERIATHLLWVFSYFSGWAEKRAISQEVEYIVSTSFVKNYHLEEVPRIVVKWGEEDEAILDLKKSMLLIVLRRGRKLRYENIAKAILKALPELLAPEMKVVYDPRLVECLSAHMARNLVKDSQPIVTAINEFVASELEKDEELRKIVSMLVEIDDESFLSRILLPELIEVAKIRYPHRDPQIDDDFLNLVKTLHSIVRGEISEPIICGKYFRILFVRVARPEKVEAMLLPHVQFVKHSLNKCPAMETVYVLAAKRNIAAAKALRMLLERELRDMGMKVKISEQEYTATYRGKPHTKLYICKLKMEKIT